MNDRLAQINAALDAWFRGEVNEFDTLAKIAQITGAAE